MEGAGTDFQKFRELEREVGSLRRTFEQQRAEAASENSAIRADMKVLERALSDLVDVLKDFQEKLDETRTRRPDMIALGGLFLALIAVGFTALGGMWALVQSQIQPIQQTQTAQTDYIRGINATHWSLEDQRVYDARRIIEHQASIADRKEDDARIDRDVQRLEDRIQWMERELMGPRP